MRKIIIYILVIIELCTLFLLYKSSTNKKNDDDVLDDVILKEEQDDKTQFRYFLEQTKGLKDYEEVVMNSFDISLFSYNNISYCTDVDGNNLPKALNYDSRVNLVVLEDKKAKKCYIYFDIK